jgi:nucleotide-binding universal stress UspA family protein
MTPTRDDRRRRDPTDPVRDYRRILVPLDGSPFAEAALRPAAELAMAAGGTLYLASVLDTGSGEALHYDPVTNQTARPVEQIAALDEYLDDVSERVREAWSCPIESRLLTDGDTADALLGWADELDADLIVAATHTRGLVVRALVGSTAKELVRETKCPVLLVPSSDPEEKEGGDIRAAMQSGVRAIVVGVDPEGDPDGVALGHARRCAESWNVPLHLVHVLTEFPLPATSPSGAPLQVDQGVAADPGASSEAQKGLERLRDALRRVGVDAHARALTGFTAADPLSDFVEEQSADLLVVGRHHRNLLERLWAGSESERLARRIRSAGLLVCPLD